MRNGVLSLAKTFSGCRASGAIPKTVLFEFLAGLSSLCDTPNRLQFGKDALIGAAEMLYSEAVFSGPEQTQLISALGTCFRRLYIIARSVASFPRLPAPKCPNRAILWPVGSNLIWATPPLTMANSNADRRWWKDPPSLSDAAHVASHGAVVQCRRFETFRSTDKASRDATALPSYFAC
jgi:hypothetical protein